MSWSSSYPPRSRSRSPRPPYPGRQPYADSSYSSDYRGGDWESYDRDRWAGYDRDRAPYDYGRRGRSRSPPPDEAGRKRRRSISPYERDRYDPRPRYSDDYDTHSRAYGYSSPPRRGHSSVYPSRRAPPDPHTFDYPATLKQYAEWFRYFFPEQASEEDIADKAAEQEAGDGSKPRNGIRSRWEKYKKDFAATQLQTMFDHHRKSPWFAEKYDPSPEFQNLRMRVRKEGWKGRLDAFLNDLEAGKFDPELDESTRQQQPPSPIKESQGHANGNDAASEQPNGSASGPAAVPTSGTGDDDMQFNMDGVDDEPGDHEASGMRASEANGKAGSSLATATLADGRRNNRGEEVSVAPEGNQVMIRTIPPDIGRLKLEDACARIPGFVYLALGDPLQKRNYYRAGWLKFGDDADMPTVLSELSEKKIEGFKLHVTHNIRPFTNRVRYAPEVASRPERMAKDLANAKVLAGILEEEAAKLRGMRLPKAGAKSAAEAKEGAGAQQPATTTGAEESSGATQPLADKDEDMASALQQRQLEELEELEEEEEPRERGSDAVERRIEKVMSELRERGVVDVNDERAYEDKKTEVALDLYLEYLRAAFNACYYCAVITDHAEELQRKCIKHARKSLNKTAGLAVAGADEAGEVEKKEDGMEDADGVEKDREREKEREGREKKDWKRNDDRWLEWLDSKVALLINREGVDPRDYSGKSYDEELSKTADPYIKQEDEGKFRCKTCQKLFKATSFVEKHIANKHPEIVKHLEDIPYFNNFALDPHHIQPFAHPPPITGNASQAAPPQAFGLQGPPAYHPDYARGGVGAGAGGGPYYAPPPPPGSFAPGAYPPPYNGYWDHAVAAGAAGGVSGVPAYGAAGGVGVGGVYAATGMAQGGGAVQGGRRLSERISGFAMSSASGEVSMGGVTTTTTTTMVPANAGLPPKPVQAALDSALVAGSGGGGGRRGRNGGPGMGGGPPPPPPPDAKEDPRAAAGKRVSYHDMDLVAEGDVELFY